MSSTTLYSDFRTAKSIFFSDSEASLKVEKLGYVAGGGSKCGETIVERVARKTCSFDYFIR